MLKRYIKHGIRASGEEKCGEILAIFLPDKIQETPRILRRKKYKKAPSKK